MSVYKYNSIRYNGGVDISNTLKMRREIPTESAKPAESAPEQAPNQPEVHEEPRVSVEDALIKREAELKLAAEELEKRKRELAALK